MISCGVMLAANWEEELKKDGVMDSEAIDGGVWGKLRELKLKKTSPIVELSMHIFCFSISLFLTDGRPQH